MNKHSLDNKQKPFYLSIDDISPYVRFVSEFKSKPNWQMRKRILYDHLIEYICDGKGRYIIKDKEYPVACGDTVFIPPGVVHNIITDNKQPFLRQCVHFDFVYVGGYDSMPWWEWFPDEPQAALVHPTPVFSEALNLPTVSHVLHLPRLRPLFSRLFREMYHKEPGYKLAVKACMLDILLHIHRNASQGGGDENSTNNPPLILPKAVAEAKKFMELKFNQKLTLAAIAEVAHYHPVHFERLFKRFMDYSPIEYLLEVRISKAREFLEDSDLNISQIALKVGFDSVQYFSLTFKKLVGFSPSRYRELMQQSTNSGIYLAGGSLKDYPTHKVFSHTP